MGKYRSQQEIWLDPATEVLGGFEGKGRTLESLHDCNLLLLKDGHAEVRKLVVEAGNESHPGRIAAQVAHIIPGASPGGGSPDVSSDRWFLTEMALARIEPNEFAPGAADYQIDISDDED
jgi:hypothetical protein